MNGLDLVLIALIGLPAFMGFRSGLVRMAASLGGIIVGITLAGQFGDGLAGLLGEFIDSETVTKILGFVIIVAVTLTVAIAIGNLVRKALTFVFLGWVDRAVGTALGLVVGAMFASVIVFILDYVPVDGAGGLVAGSSLAGFFLDVVFPLADVLPGNLDDLRVAAQAVIGAE